MMRKLFNGVWVTELHSPDGATALIADHGAHLLAWTPAGGQEALYLSERSTYGGDSAIRGGVPIIFPQFGERGSGRRHGFARSLAWRQDFAGIEQGRGLARFSLSSDHATGCGWPHRFELVFEVAFAGPELRLTLGVHNPSDQEWEFCAALHTYLRISDIAAIELAGLQANRYLDQAMGGIAAIQDAQNLHIDGEVDRIYLGTQAPVVLNDGRRAVVVENQGFNDVVVWNPGAEKAALIGDMAAQDYRSFVCVEAGAIDHAVPLGAGESWSGSQTLSVRSR